jgi:hypothetical protein
MYVGEVLRREESALKHFARAAQAAHRREGTTPYRRFLRSLSHTYIHSYVCLSTYHFLQVSAEKAALKKEFEFQMGLAQEESEKLVAGLENAIQNMTKEKVGSTYRPHYRTPYFSKYIQMRVLYVPVKQTALSSELESLSLKLEETEDQLFDSRQEVKRRATEQALAMWKTTTSVLQMKEKFGKGMYSLVCLYV